MACTCAPGKALCRSCLNKTSTPYVGPLVKSNGELTIHQVDIFQKQFESNIVADIEKNPLSAAVNRYGADFYKTVDKINNDFFKRDSIISIIPNYPILNERIKRSPITPLEFAAFIADSSYTPATAIISSDANGPRFCLELNNFYNGDFSTSVLGGFCGLFGNIFGAISGFFDLIDSIGGIIADVAALIGKIKDIENPLDALWKKIKVKALLESIKSKVEEMLRKAIQKVCMSISNFDVEAITGPINSAAQVAVVAKVEDKKTALQQVCGDENAERIIKKINDLINYAAGLFSNPSVEEIMFLISRICALATGIEEVFKRLRDPLDDFSNRYTEVFNTISNASNRVTGEAIRAGAIRLDETERQKQINIARVEWEAAGNISPVTTEELKNLPSWTALQNGTDSRLKIRGGWTTRMRPPSEGWLEMDLDVKVMVMRLQKEAKNAGIIDSYLWLNSGYRSQWYNDLLRSEGQGAAKNSLHMSGLAADLKWPGYRARSTKATQFVQLARRIGFKGIGLYNGFIHVDIGAQRLWDRRK